MSNLPSSMNSFVTKVKVENSNQDRELISSNKTLKLFTFSKSNHFEAELNHQRQSKDQNSSITNEPNVLESTTSGSKTVTVEEMSNKDSNTRTVDELLKMLSGKGSSNKPPPLPPKPKSSNLSDNSFMRFFSSKTNNNVTKEDGVDSGITKAHNSQISRDSSSYRDQIASLRPTTEPDSMSQGTKKFIELSKHFPHESTSVTILPTTEINVAEHAIKPIVTESLEEANNNNLVKTNNKSATNKSTVEILEVPYKQTLQNTYGVSNNNQTFSRTAKQQLFYENNSDSYPVVTSATDDEDDDQDDNSNYARALHTELEVELLNESSKDIPPRTSTPNTSVHNTLSEISTTRNRNNVNSKTEFVHSNSEETDTLNISRETDEFNTSNLNQSSGGELVGVNDNSDQANQSKNSPNTSSGQNKMPYTVQVFNDTLLNSQKSPPRLNFEQSQKEDHSICEEKIKKLERLTESLTEHIDSLKSQVVSLTCKVDELELKANSSEAEQNKFLSPGRSNYSTSNLPSKYSESHHKTGSSISKAGYSQSAFNIDRLSLNPQRDHTSTYSRNSIATISRNNVRPNSNGHMSASLSNNNRISSTPSSGNAINSKTIKRTNVHASTNSLYAESVNSTNASISPTFNSQNYRQGSSPTSTLNSLSAKRDPLYHTSMLSLSSIGCLSNATLKKGSAVSGSITNLSQNGNQLTNNWLSMSNFVPSKQQGKEIDYSPNDGLIQMFIYNSLITMRVPDWIRNDYHLDKVVEPPTLKLKLDWVYGYRGRDCRSNIFYLPTGECIYFVASIVVLYDPDQKTQRHYLGHTDSVKCLAVHPNKLYIASGQSTAQAKLDKRPIVRVWNTITLATLRVIGFNEDFDCSICCLAFSKHDQGATLAVVDESTEHTITLLDWQREKNWRLAETNSGHDPVLAIDFHPIDKYSLVAVGKSTINFWDIRGMTMTKKAGLFDKYDKPKYVLCLTFNDFGDTITGDSNGNLIIWPRGANRPKKIIHDAHAGGVFSVLAMKDGTYLTGGRDRRIVEWDEEFQRTGREAELPEHCGGVRYITYARGSQVLIGTLRNSILIGSLDNNFLHIMQGHTEAISALAVHPSQNQYITGGFDEQIHLFDSKSHEVVWTKCLMMPASAAGFSPTGTMLIIGSTLGKWIVIDVITQEIVFTKCDGSGTINCIKFSPDGQYFCLGSSDMQIYVYQATAVDDDFYRVGTCIGHSSPIKEIDWSEDSRYIQSQSTNLELLHWTPQTCKPLEDLEVIDDIKWFTQNCTIGFNVIGLWSDPNDSAYTNCCDKSNEEDLIVSATNAGNINIFKWPTCYNQCLSQKHYGNVDKFSFIKFLPDDSKLIAVGAKNCVTTEWSVDKDNI